MNWFFSLVNDNTPVRGNENMDISDEWWESKLVNFSSIDAKCSEEFACVNRQASVRMRLSMYNGVVHRIYTLAQNASPFMTIGDIIILPVF